MSEHAGTHTDSTAYEGAGGGLWVDALPLETYMGSCRKLDFSNVPDDHRVTVDEIKSWETKYGQIKKGEIVLVYFGGHEGREGRKYPGLNPEASAFIVKREAKLLGCDTREIDDWSPYWTHDGGRKQYGEYTEPAHLEALLKGVPIVEKVQNLDKVPPTGAYFIGLPLKIKEGSGSPIRAIALVPKKK